MVFFKAEQIEEIQELIISKDFLFIHSLFERKTGHPDQDSLILKVINSKNIFLIWGMIQLYSDLADATLEPYLHQIVELEDPILDNRISLYRESLSKDFESYYHEEQDYMENEEGQEIPVDPCDFIGFVSQMTQDNAPYDMEKIQAKREEILAQLEKL